MSNILNADSVSLMSTAKREEIVANAIEQVHVSKYVNGTTDLQRVKAADFSNNYKKIFVTAFRKAMS